MDLLADNQGDMAIIDGEISFVTGQAAIAQHIAFRIRTFLGESRYNRSEGVPWYQVIFRPSTTNQARKFIITEVVLGTKGVTGCTMDDIDLDPQTRGATISGRAVTVEGEVDFTLTVPIEI
jgi:hypothetical protein